MYRNDREVVLTWKIVPPDGHLFNIKCYFTSQHANKETLISVLDKGKQVKLYNGLKNDRSSVMALDGYFNITIKRPTRSEKGRYRCAFFTEESLNVSATVFLLQGKMFQLIIITNKNGIFVDIY